MVHETMRLCVIHLAQGSQMFEFELDELDVNVMRTISYFFNRHLSDDKKSGRVSLEVILHITEPAA